MGWHFQGPWTRRHSMFDTDIALPHTDCTVNGITHSHHPAMRVFLHFCIPPPGLIFIIFFQHEGTDSSSCTSRSSWGNHILGQIRRHPDPRLVVGKSPLAHLHALASMLGFLYSYILSISESDEVVPYKYVYPE
jgi:hypothetical protein